MHGRFRNLLIAHLWGGLRPNFLFTTTVSPFQSSGILLVKSFGSSHVFGWYPSFVDFSHPVFSWGLGPFRSSNNLFESWQAYLQTLFVFWRQRKILLITTWILSPQPKILKRISSWWVVSTHLKNMLAKLDHFPNFRGENKKYLSCHHPVTIPQDPCIVHFPYIYHDLP